MNFSNQEQNKNLKDFLKSDVADGWAISRVYFSNPSWNMMCRSLIRADLLPKHTNVNIIRIKDLSQITVRDILDLLHVGNHRVDRLISELQQLDESISDDFLQEKTRFENSDSDLNQDNKLFYELPLHSESTESVNQITLEVSLVVRMITSLIWREEFETDFGYPFNDLEFEDETIERNLLILAGRLDGLTLDALGKEYGVTRERIRQIINKLLTKAEKFPEVSIMNLKTLLEQRLEMLKYAPKLSELNLRSELDLKARQIINTKPGIKLEELSSILMTDIKLLHSALGKHTKKFVYTEEKINTGVSSFTDDEILEALRLAEAFESPINRNLYDNLVNRGLIKGPGSQTVMKRFSTWNKACQLADVNHNESVRDSYETLWTKDEMLDYVIEFLKNRTFGVGINSYDEWRIETLSNAPSGAHLRNNFDTWINAKNEALQKMLGEKISPGLV